MEDEELRPADLEAAWAAGRPAAVTPSRPRMIVEGRKAGVSSRHFGIKIADAKVEFHDMRFSSPGLRIESAAAEVHANTVRR